MNDDFILVYESDQITIDMVKALALYAEALNTEKQRPFYGQERTAEDIRIASFSIQQAFANVCDVKEIASIMGYVEEEIDKSQKAATHVDGRYIPDMHVMQTIINHVGTMVNASGQKL